MLKKIILIVLAVITVIIMAGIYRFNFTNADIYVEDSGQIIAWDHTGQNEVMRTLFSFKTDNIWQIKLPESKAKAPLTELEKTEEGYYAKGQYRDGDELGLVRLNSSQITMLNVEYSSSVNIFIVPFSVSNQGSGVFWYLGLFKLNADNFEIKHLDSLFLGDRIRIKKLIVDSVGDGTGNIRINYLQHAQTQSMSEIPVTKLERNFGVIQTGFLKSN